MHHVHCDCLAPQYREYYPNIRLCYIGHPCHCHTRLGAVVLYHVLVVNSVFFILGIKSVRSLGCLLYSLYFLREDLVC